MPGPSKHQDEKPPRPRNFFARREQLRLFFLVGMLMLVVILMSKAADPQTWAWMWGGAIEVDGGGELTPAERADREDVDTRLKPTEGDREAALPGTITTPRNVRPAEIKLEGEAQAAATTEREAWKAQLESLDRHDRKLLPRVLRAVRTGEPLNEDDQQRWVATLAQLDASWVEYTEVATKRVQDDDSLSDEDRASCCRYFTT